MKRQFTSTQIRMDPEDYRLLRKLAYLKQRSINSLMVEGVKIIIEKDVNVLKNSDIVLP